MNTAKYWELTKIGFKEASAYRLDAATGLVSSVLYIVLYYYIWQAIAASGTLSSSLTQVMTYIVVGQVVSGALFISIEGLIGERVRKGTIVNELKRPISLFSQAYFKKLGVAIFRVFTRALPVLLLGIFYLQVKLPKGLNVFYFGLSLFLGLNLVMLLSYTTSMLIFWTKVDWSIRGVRSTVQKLFSGVMFPLYLLPPDLSLVFNLLPFKYMVDGPIQIFLMQKTGFEAVKILGLQFAWVLVLLIVAHLAWKKARTKLTVQGG
ncbi:MAG: ABC transporter permease [Candidatus Nanohalobium sp.]